MEKHPEIDHVDIRILSELMKDAKTPYTEIAERIFVSGGTVHVRMKKMEKMGIVKGSTLDLDLSKLGYDITAFLGIYLEKSSLYEEVCEELKKVPEIVNLHYTTGDYSIFVRINCKDTNHLREVLHDKIQCIPGITRTDTMISLEEKFSRPLQITQEKDSAKV
ncbi:Lrp/AsnC family transcriptional regulator [Sediminitomix flava]|uniref:AsnC family transcriptional regulator n=1 Tax=Sediminitomix flava TaxID=379075 RepID=A0A315ZI26_SEDFL|nr:Lrp/AsnC ligand binding domain-containing protein [Sediminitomix flava]PWJ44869.1 AsnC family transcriptional regulator [Sediminitomix flava]